MKIACLLMQKNEPLILEAWIKYHAHIFGYENLYIFDNGSTDLVCRYLLDHFREMHGINVSYDFLRDVDFERKGQIVLDKILELDMKGSYDFLIPLDCDEFLALKNQSGFAFDRDGILPYFEAFIGDPRALEVGGCLYNIPKRPNFYYGLDVKKTIFTRGTAGSLDLGYHDGRSRLTPDRAPIDVLYFHFHNKPFEILRAHARSKLGRRVTDFEPITLSEYRGQGEHLTRYFKMEEVDYLNSFPVNGARYIPEFRLHLEKIGATIPY